MKQDTVLASSSPSKKLGSGEKSEVPTPPLINFSDFFFRKTPVFVVRDYAIRFLKQFKKKFSSPHFRKPSCFRNDHALVPATQKCLRPDPCVAVKRLTRHTWIPWF